MKGNFSTLSRTLIQIIAVSLTTMVRFFSLVSEHLIIEFLAASLSEDVYKDPKRLMQAFKILDKDQNGKIDATELKEVLSSELGTEDKFIWMKLISASDVDGDGQINFEEFLKMMNNPKN